MANFNFPPIQGWMSEREMEWLYEQAKKMVNVVEIGSWKGRSTYALLSGCKGSVYAVDHWKGSPDEIDQAHTEAKTTDIYAIFLNNVGHFKNLKVMKMSSEEAAKHFPPKSVDMVFIDGCHAYEYVRKDIDLWLPRTRRLICGHDCGQAGVPQATHEVFGQVETVHGIWFRWLSDN